MKLEYFFRQNVSETDEHVKFWWFPHTRNCVVWRANRIPKKDAFKRNPINVLFDVVREKIFMKNILQILIFLSIYMPKLTPIINIIYFYLFYKREKQITDQSYNIFKIPELIQQKFVCEWSIPDQNVQLAVKTLKEFILKENIKAHFPVEFEYTKSDDIYLSPSFGRDSCFVSINSFLAFGKITEHKKYFDGFERIMKYFGGRPAWKNPKIDTEKIQQNYPMLKKFKEIRQKLDPEMLFYNELIEILE